MGAWVTRALRNFNVENRAERELSKMKPLSAPRHPSTKSLLQDQMSRHPEIEGEISRKDDKLLSLLRDVYVNSKDPVSLKIPWKEEHQCRMVGVGSLLSSAQWPRDPNKYCQPTVPEVQCKGQKMPHNSRSCDARDYLGHSGSHQVVLWDVSGASSPASYNAPETELDV